MGGWMHGRIVTKAHCAILRSDSIFIIYLASKIKVSMLNTKQSLKPVAPTRTIKHKKPDNLILF